MIIEGSSDAMDWFLNPTTVSDKLIVMVVAILLFVAIMGGILYVIDRPRIPNWLVVVGFLGPVTFFMGLGLLYPALGTVYRSFQVSQNAVGPDMLYHELDDSVRHGGERNFQVYIGILFGDLDALARIGV